jgi:cytochrome c biogenesis protein CcdA/thiol-disulfide isomerase/thioredoxin
MRTPTTLTRPPRRAVTAAAVAVFGALVLLLAGCTAQTPGLLSSSPSPGYLSADETVREIPADQRDDPVTFTGTTDTGEQADSTAWAGSVVVVNFWYAACPPCRAEAPDLEALAQTYQPDGVVFIGVNVRDSADTAAAFENQFGITYPSILDATTGTVQAAFAGKAAPAPCPPQSSWTAPAGWPPASSGNCPPAPPSPPSSTPSSPRRAPDGEIITAGSIWAALLALLAGLVSFASPACSPRARLPRLPHRHHHHRGGLRWRALAGTGLFTLGFSVLFIGYGAAFGALGAWLIRWQDLLTRILGIVVLLMGLVFLGVFRPSNAPRNPPSTHPAGWRSSPARHRVRARLDPVPGPHPRRDLRPQPHHQQPCPRRPPRRHLLPGPGVALHRRRRRLNWATGSITFLRRHIRTINITGGVLMIATGIAMISGAWTLLTSSIQNLIGATVLPL